MAAWLRISVQERNRHTCSTSSSPVRVSATVAGCSDSRNTRMPASLFSSSIWRTSGPNSTWVMAASSRDFKKQIINQSRRAEKDRRSHEHSALQYLDRLERLEIDNGNIIDPRARRRRNALT